MNGLYIFRYKSSTVVHGCRFKFASLGTWYLDSMFGGGVRPLCHRGLSSTRVVSSTPTRHGYVSCKRCRKVLTELGVRVREEPLPAPSYLS